MKHNKEIHISTLAAKITAILAFLIIVGLTACSSLPKNVPNRSQTFANIKMTLARDMQKKQDYSDALRLYKDAYDYFTRVDDIKGKIQAALSIARQNYYLDKTPDTQKWIKIAGDLIRTYYPQMEDEKNILLIEMAFGKQDYNEVIKIAEARDASLDTPAKSHKNIENPEFQAEILCYTVVSKALLASKYDYKPGLTQLQTLLNKLQEKFDKKGMDDPETLSVGYYYLGYIYGTVEKNWKNAMIFFEKARDVDSKIDNAYGLGKDLFSLGQCYKATGIINEARSSYQRALEIFELLKNNEMIEKTSKELENLN